MELVLVSDQVLLLASQLVAVIGVAIITIVAIKSAISFIKAIYNHTPISINFIRLELGYSIILGLEFMVGADIIESIAKRSYYELGILAGLVLIRTFLSYFLTKELEVAHKFKN